MTVSELVYNSESYKHLTEYHGNMLSHCVYRYTVNNGGLLILHSLIRVTDPQTAQKPACVCVCVCARSSVSPYVLVNHQMESIAPCREDVVLQGCGPVVCVHHMTGLQAERGHMRTLFTAGGVPDRTRP